jgi:hypothetical protein
LKLRGYISLASVDESAAKVEKPGGKICMPKTAVPEMGYFVICQDPENNTFALWENQRNRKISAPTRCKALDISPAAARRLPDRLGIALDMRPPTASPARTVRPRPDRRPILNATKPKGFQEAVR